MTESAIDWPWHTRHQDVIAQGCLTNSKSCDAHVFGFYPTVIRSATMEHVICTQGHMYLDFICGLGTNLYGYGHPWFQSAITRYIANGATHSFPTVHEVECAEELRLLFPWAQKVKFLKTGTDACNASIRMARAYTGRKKVLSQGYHGWGDLFVSMTPPAAGIGDDFSVEELTTLDQIGNDVACVILEPVITDATNERKEWLISLQAKCREQGVILIFDEIVTGFRFYEGTVAEAWGLEPDILLLSKALAFGMPLSAVIGRNRDLMDNKLYFVSTTTAGDILSLASATAALKYFRHCKKHGLYDSFIQGSGLFIQRLNEIMKPSKIYFEGYGTRTKMCGTATDRAIFCQEMAKQNILFHSSTVFTNHPLMSSSNMARVWEAAEWINENMRDGKIDLVGKMPVSPFAQKVREKL